MFTIVALPLVLYPLLGILLLLFGLKMLTTETTIGLVRGESENNIFPDPPSTSSDRNPCISASLIAASGQANGNISGLLTTAAMVRVSRLPDDYPLLIEDNQVPEPILQPVRQKPSALPAEVKYRFVFLDKSKADTALQSGEVDTLVYTSTDFMDQVIQGKNPSVKIQSRKHDEKSRLASEQLMLLLARWKSQLREVRFSHNGLPNEFGEPFLVQNTEGQSQEEVLQTEQLLDLFVRSFPMMLVMWSLAGALHLAVDICAGEKERGTMETLLISPAGREEIVFGKFLTIWVFSSATAVMHLFSMMIATTPIREQLPSGSISLLGLVWCFILILPLSALFSAVTLAIGAYARSSKEGQNYLMPLFWVTMPLILITMIPGVELNPFYSMIPVAGVALLMQKLMLTSTLAEVPWFYFIPVLATISIYSWLALRWAIVQFQSESVLFRVSDGISMGLWLRNLFREKQATPTFHQALFCFFVLITIRWLFWDVGTEGLMLTRTVAVLLAFLVAPPLFMALLLTTQPRQTLYLYLPNWRLIVAGLLLLPLVQLGYIVMTWFPQLMQMLRDRQSFAYEASQQLGQGSLSSLFTSHILVLGLLTAACKEIAFRGFILSGLRNRLHDWTAILFGSFLFAVYHMNVFALAPAFVLGVLAGWLTVRSSSIIPAIVLHMGCNILLLTGPLVYNSTEGGGSVSPLWLAFFIPLAIICSLLAIYVLRQKPNKRIASELESTGNLSREQEHFDNSRTV